MGNPIKDETAASIAKRFVRDQLRIMAKHRTPSRATAAEIRALTLEVERLFIRMMHCNERRV